MRSLMMRTIAAAAATMTLAGALTGCSAGSKNLTLDQYGQAVAATMGDEKIYLDEVNYYTRYNQWNMEMFQSLYFGQDATAEYWNHDVGGGRTNGDLMVEDAIATIRQERILNAHAGEFGVALNEEDQKKVDEAAAVFTDRMDPSLIAAINTDEAFIKGMLTRNILANKVYDAMVADIDQNVSDEQLSQKKIAYLTFKKDDTAETNPEQQANDVMNRILAGEDIQAIADELELTVGTRSFGLGEFTGELGAAAELLNTGETAVVSDDSNWYALVCTDANDMSSAETRKERILSERKDARFKELFLPMQEKSPIKVDKTVLSNIKFSKALYVAPPVESSATETTAAETTAAAESTSAAETTAAAESTSAAESTTAAETTKAN